MDILPALLNNVKMMQQISRYYNTNERMTTLYVKLSSQLINMCGHMCRMNLTRKGKPWDQNPDEVVANMPRHWHKPRDLENKYSHSKLHTQVHFTYRIRATCALSPIDDLRALQYECTFISVDITIAIASLSCASASSSS